MDALEALRLAGWHEGRAASIRRAERALRREGHEFFPAARAFLRSFSGITVRWMRDGLECSATIDGATAARLEPRARIREYERIVGVPLVPVGGYSHMVLMIGEDERLVPTTPSSCRWGTQVRRCSTTSCAIPAESSST